MAKEVIGKVVTGKVRFSYLHVFEPESINGSEPKYSVSLLIPKSDKATLSAIKKAVEDAKQAGASKWGGKIPPNLKLPLRDGDTDAPNPDDENYRGHYFVNANSSASNRPHLVDSNLQAIIDSTELYSGCYGRASVTFYPFNANGNRGVACGLNHLQKLADGEPLSGRSSAEEDFGGFDDEEEDNFLS